MSVDNRLYNPPTWLHCIYFINLASLQILTTSIFLFPQQCNLILGIWSRIIISVEDIHGFIYSISISYICYFISTKLITLAEYFKPLPNFAFSITWNDNLARCVYGKTCKILPSATESVKYVICIIHICKAPTNGNLPFESNTQELLLYL